MAELESFHFIETDGPLKSADGTVCNVADFARLLAEHEDKPPVPVALDVLLAIEREQVNLYLTRPLRLAERLSSERRDLAIKSLRSAWSDESRVRRPEDMYIRAKSGGQIAALPDDLWRIMGYGDTDSYVPSDGFTWEHVAGAGFTSDERDELFRMRFKWGMTDSQITAVVGVSRQAIDNAIGGRTAIKNKRFPETFKPSAALLRECSLSHLQDPMQVVSAALANEVRETA